MKQTNISKLIPVMLAFFCMGFVDMVGIATNYVKVDFGLNDTLANMGAMNEAIALTNCPNVSELAKRLPRTILDSNGLIDTCINVFPMPNKEKEINIIANE